MPENKDIQYINVVICCFFEIIPVSKKNLNIVSDYVKLVQQVGHFEIKTKKPQRACKLNEIGCAICTANLLHYILTNISDGRDYKLSHTKTKTALSSFHLSWGFRIHRFQRLLQILPYCLFLHRIFQ